MNILIHTDGEGGPVLRVEATEKGDFLAFIRRHPIVPLDPADIAWPDGERWAHLTEAFGLLPETPTQTKEAA